MVKCLSIFGAVHIFGSELSILMHFIMIYLLQKMKKFSSLGSCNQSKMNICWYIFCQSTNILWVDNCGSVHVVRIGIKFRGKFVVCTMSHLLIPVRTLKLRNPGRPVIEVGTSSLQNNQSKCSEAFLKRANWQDPLLFMTDLVPEM